MAEPTATRYRALRSGLLLSLAGLLLVGAAAARPNVVGSWTGVYALPAGPHTAAISVSLAGGRAVVSLAPGHAAYVRVPATQAGGILRFSVPGRPSDLSFAGRMRGRTIAGAVRQGAARGTFRLVATTGPAIGDSLGTYELDSGGAVAIADYRRLGLPLWEIDLTSGAFHALARTGSGFAAGPTVLATTPAVAKLSVVGDRLTWTPNSGAPVTGSRLAVKQYEVRFPSGRAMLAGTLSIPRAPGPHPAVALVHGSGPALRDEGQFLTALLLQHGIAVLSYDKRGNGESTGLYPGEDASNSNIDVYARDADAAVLFLSRQPELDPSRLGLVGGSQAGWIIPLAAARLSKVSFAIMQSGPTVTVDETADYSSYTSQGAAPLTLPLDEIEARVKRDALGGFDPKPWIKQLRIPILWLFGGLDMNQPSHLDVQVLEQLKAETGHDYTWKLYPAGNHGIFEVKTGLNDELTTSPGMPAAFFADVADWLRAHQLARGASPL